MRKRRVFVIGSDRDTAADLTRFFDDRGYESVLVRMFGACPVARQNEQCPRSAGCGDLAVIRHEPPILNAIDLLAAQEGTGCGLALENKAVIASSFADEERARLTAWGVPFFTLPLDLRILAAWVLDRESRMDLTRPVAVRRMEERVESHHEGLSLLINTSEVEHVALVNKSGCGACFRTTRRFTRNQIFKVLSYEAGTSEDAVVRWINPDTGGAYLVGLSYCA